MKQKLHALYLMAPGEKAPSSRLQECATIAPLNTAGDSIASLPIEKVDFLALKLPIHPLVQERMDDLRKRADLAELPVLGIGPTTDKKVSACTTEDIQLEDLNTVLELLCELNRCELLVQEEQKELAHSQTELVQIANEFVDVISMLLDLRIPEASRRGRRVAEAAEYIGKQLGLEDKVLRELTWAAKLRELGKSGLSDEILAKPPRMRTESERNLYERYPVWGGIVLGGMPGLRGAATMIYHALENFDGTGYPDGLRGEAIPIGSRILHVTATFEVIATDLGGSPKTALEVLERGANRQFDPLIVKLMGSYLQFAVTPDWDSNIIRVQLGELEEGQTLAEDLWTRSGVKLLPQGAKLTQHKIKLILNYRTTDPMVDSVAVYRTEKK